MRTLLALLLALPLLADDADPAKLPTRPAAPPEEVAGAVLIVSYKGAPKALPGVSRSKEEARARAEEALRAARAKGASFDDVVAKYSDDAGNRGRMAAMAPGQCPFPDLEKALFGMQVGQVSDIIESDFGYLIVTRMTARVTALLIFVTYQGAKGALDSVTRSKEEARAIAERARHRIVEGKEDFDAVAAETSDLPPREPGADLVPIPRGLLPPAAEDAAFALDHLQVSEVIETEAGFYVIKALPPALHWHASIILFTYKGSKGAAPTVTRSKEEARALAEAVLKRLSAGEDFAKLASENSDDTSKAKGGDIGGFNHGQEDPALEKAVSELKVGGHSGIVEDPEGFLIVLRTQ